MRHPYKLPRSPAVLMLALVTARRHKPPLGSKALNNHMALCGLIMSNCQNRGPIGEALILLSIRHRTVEFENPQKDLIWIITHHNKPVSPKLQP